MTPSTRATATWPCAAYRIRVIAVVSAGVVAAPALGQFSFQGIGFLPGGSPPFSSAEGVSGDGLVVVGQSSTAGALRAVRWTRVGGIQSLDIPGFSGESGAHAASADGSVVAGYGLGPPAQAYRWEGAGGMGLGHLPGSTRSGAAYSVSADGSVVVGSDRFPGSVFQQAFRWTSGGGMQGLGTIEGSGFFSFGNAVSADGQVAAGYSSSSSGFQAFRWTAGAGMQGLGALLSGDPFSEAFAASSDGSVIVGFSNAALGGAEAFRWTAGDGMQGLGDLPGEPHSSVARGVSGDGQVIVGAADFDPVTGMGRAFIWDEQGGMRDLRAVLADAGVTGVAGWALWSAQAVSADGTVIVGAGLDPEGRRQGWIAEAPRACAADFNGDGIANVQDFLAYLTAYDGGEPRADINGDGVINVQDFLAFLTAYAAGCS